jgi:flagellar motor protein MotB
MAELMLLLMFCLLLVSASALQKKNQKIAELGGAPTPLAEAGQPATKLAEARPTPPLVAPASAATADPAQQWRELVPANDPAAAAQLVETVRALQANGLATMTSDQIAAMARDYQALKQEGLAEISSQNLIQALTTRTGPDASGHNWPPIITLSDDGFSFEVNSAELTAQFRNRLQTDVTEQVLALIKRYNVDVVEVVGHTDEQPIRSSRASTMDTQAVSAMAGQTSIQNLIPSDNAGLGLARAIAVANALKGTGKLDQVKVLPLSGAQMIMPGDKLTDGSEAGDASSRRRIEIRVRRSASAEQ